MSIHKKKYKIISSKTNNKKVKQTRNITWMKEWMEKNIQCIFHDTVGCTLIKDHISYLRW